MLLLARNWPWLCAMSVLICFSAFFSASEAILFCLRWSDRRMLAAGTRSQREAERLLTDPDRLLSAVLFWNLLTNIAYFAISSIVGIRLQNTLQPTHHLVIGFAVGSLLLLIFFSEMLPKSIAVLQPRRLAGYVGLPLSLTVRILDPIMPVMRNATQLSRRLIAPRILAESPLELDDIDRAIDQSSADKQLVIQEHIVLGNIISLSTITASEWMRPRKRLRALVPPITLDNLRELEAIDEYVLVTDPRGDDIVGAIGLSELHELPAGDLQRAAKRVAVVPWCASLANVMESLQQTSTDVAAIVNEHGETIGVITLQDVWDAVFMPAPTRAERLLESDPIVQVGHNTMRVNGIINLSTLEKRLNIDLPESVHATIAGVVQEQLERLPMNQDRCTWGPLEIEVLEADAEAGLSLLIKKRESFDEGNV